MNRWVSLGCILPILLLMCLIFGYFCSHFIFGVGNSIPYPLYLLMPLFGVCIGAGFYHFWEEFK